MGELVFESGGHLVQASRLWDRMMSVNRAHPSSDNEFPPFISLTEISVKITFDRDVGFFKNESGSIVME